MRLTNNHNAKKTLAAIISSGLLILGAYSVIPQKQINVIELKQDEIKSIINDGFECNLPTGYIKFIPIKKGLFEKKISFADKKIVNNKKIKIVDEFNNEYEVKEEGGTWKKISIIKQRPKSNLTLKFKIKTNFSLPEGEITKPIKLADKTWLMPSTAWDDSLNIEPEKDKEIRERLNLVNIRSFIIKEDGEYYLVKELDEKWLDNAKYPIYTDATITYGDEYVFNNTMTHYIAVDSLDSTHFVVAYGDDGGNYYGKVRIGVVDNSSITYGSTVIFNNATTTYIAVTSLDSTHFVVAYRDDGNSGKGTAKKGTISGTNISLSSGYIFNNGATQSIDIDAFYSTKFVVVYRDYSNSSYGTAIIGSVSGSTITYGSEYVFNSANTVPSVAVLSTSYFAVFYSDWGVSYGNCRIGSVSGSTISFGNEYVINDSQTYYPDIAALSSTKFAMVYRDYGNSNCGTVRIATTSGSTNLSYGNEYVFNNSATSYISISSLDSDNFVISYRDEGNSYYGTGIIGTTVGKEIDHFSNEKVFNSADNFYIKVASLNNKSFVTAYEDVGNSYYGTGIIGKFSGIVEYLYTNEIKDNSIKANGYISYSNSTTTERGFVYATTSQALPGNVSPTSTSYTWYVKENGTYATGTYDLPISGLTENTTYYIRAYGKDNVGYFYSEEENTFIAGAIEDYDTSNDDFNEGEISSTTISDDKIVLSSSAELKDTESYETSLGDWSNVPCSGCSNECWIRDSGGTPSSSTGPDHAQDGSYYMYLETSSGYCYNDGDEDYLEYTLSQSTKGQIEFYYHMYGSNIGTLSLDYYNGSWHNFWSISGQQQTSCSDDYTFVSAEWTANATKIRFRGTAAGGYRGDMAIDYVKVYEDNGYVASGYYISTTTNISYLYSVDDSYISWSETLNGQTLTVYTRYSTNGGSTWSSWSSVTNGGTIPGLDSIGTGNSNALMQYKVEMSGDGSSTPELLDITLRAEYEAPTSTTPQQEKPKPYIIIFD